MQNAFRVFAFALLPLMGLVTQNASGVVEFGASFPIDENAVGDEKDDIDPMLATDGQGTWVAVWWATEVDGLTASPGEVRLARSTDAGATWSEPALEDTIGAAAGTDAEPTVATDRQGLWIASWVSFHSLGGTIGNDYDLLVAQSIDAGATWSAPVPLNTNAGSDAGADLSVNLVSDGQSTWVATWESSDSLGGSIGDDSDILVTRSIDGGSTWMTPTPLDSNANDDSNEDTNPAIATDGQGNWIATWESRPLNSDTHIRTARSTDNGATWAAPFRVSRSTGGNFAPRVTTDGRGSWVVVWGSNVTLGGAIGRDYDILMVRSMDVGATWTALAALNTNAANDSGDDGLPKVTTDGSGKWLAVWNSSNSFGGTPGGRDFDILTAESTDGGVTWTAPAPLNTNAGCDVGDDLDAYLETDGHGNWVAIWESDGSRGGTIGTDEDVLVTLPESDPARCQSRAQQACTNALNADFAKVARAQDSAIAKCTKNHARRGESATACLALENTGLQRALSKTRADEARRCVASRPDFGPTDADTVNLAAVSAERATLAWLFGADLDAAIVSQVDDAGAAKCQQAVVKSVYKCQSTEYKEFNRCKKNALRKGGATSAVDVSRCLAFDPKAKIAKKCDPESGALTTKVLPRSCAGVDLSAVFPGCSTADPDALANCVDEVVACQICLGLSHADNLNADCDLFDDDEANASCTSF